MIGTLGNFKGVWERPLALFSEKNQMQEVNKNKRQAQETHTNSNGNQFPSAMDTDNVRP